MTEWVRGSDGIYRAQIHDRSWSILKQSNFGYQWIVRMGSHIMKYAFTLREGKEYVEEYICGHENVL